MNPSAPTLERYKGRYTRHTCPQCGKPFQLTRYVFPDTGKQVHPMVGKCNRVSKCGYHYPPRQFFIDHPEPQSMPVWQSTKPMTRKKAVALPPPSTIPKEQFQQSQSHYDENNFVKWLQKLFAKSVAMHLVRLYQIGTSKFWPGATVFWQVDAGGNVRAGKIMHYDAATGRRTKHPVSRVTWVHSVLGLQDYQLRQCLFGEHLLAQFPDKPVAIVESEKTAIVCSVFLPGFVWLATGGVGNLSDDLLKPLRGRKVVLFPDLGAFDQWKSKAAQIKWCKRLEVSDYLEENAPIEARQSGYDLADFLVNPDPQTGHALTAAGYPAYWDFQTVPGQSQQWMKL